MALLSCSGVKISVMLLTFVQLVFGIFFYKTGHLTGQIVLQCQGVGAVPFIDTDDLFGRSIEVKIIHIHGYRSFRTGFESGIETMIPCHKIHIPVAVKISGGETVPPSGGVCRPKSLLDLR